MSTTYFRLTALSVAMVMGAAAASAQPTPLLGFDFNEGAGDTIADLAGEHVGTFGVEIDIDPETYVRVVEDHPSGEGASVFFPGTDGLGASDADDPFLPALVEGPITAEVWVKVESHPGNTDFFRYGQTYKFGFHSSGNLLFTHLGIVDINSEVLVEPGDWVHVAVVWDPEAALAIYYLNGEEADVREVAGIARDAQDNNLWIGSSVGGASSQLHGTMSRLRLHNAALDADELDSDAANPKPIFDSTVLHYELDELPAINQAGPALPADGEREAADAAAVANSMPVWSEDSATGLPGNYSLYFNGLGSRVTVPDPNLDFQFWGDEFTLEAYVKYDNLPTTRCIVFSYGVPGQGGYSFSVTRSDHGGGDYRVGRKVFVTTYGILDANNNSEIPDDGEWHHIAVVHDVVSQELRFYVNGELGDTRSYTSGINFTDQRNALYIGVEGSPGSIAPVNPFHGYIDRIRIHDIALSAGDFDIVERVSVNRWDLY